MKAMILAAGYGTRLGDMTKTTPKCLVTAGGKTMLQHVLEKLKLSGVNDVIINLYYLGEQIEAYLARNQSFGMNITFSKEPELLGTGGALEYAKGFFNKEESFFLLNSDVYSNIDLLDLYRLHEKTGAYATLAIMKRPSSRSLLFNNKLFLRGHENLKEGTSIVFGSDELLTPFAFSGIQVINTSLLKYFSDGKYPYSTITSFLKAAEAGEMLSGYIMDDQLYWIDIGTPEKLQELNTFLLPKSELI
jgi:N-acetyl-alpha-D-muramate 1-phosphate uridylyltransferase